MNIFALLMLALWTGVVSSITAKTAYEVKDSSPHCTDPHNFNKSFFFTFAMFIGEAGCLVYYYMYFSKPLEPREIMMRMRSPTGNISDAPISVNSSGDEVAADLPKPPLPKWVFALLCLFDTTATSVNFIGLNWISASLNQMFRGALVIFVALFSIVFLNRRPTVGQWQGIGLVTLGIVICGIGSVVSSANDSGTNVSPVLTVVGVLLTLLSCVLNGAQNVLEEKLMKALNHYAEPHPMEIVGWEGVFGASLVLFVILPITQFIPGSDCGSVENSLDTVYIFTRDWKIFLLVFGFVVSLGAMNGLSMEIGRVLSAVYRNLVSSSRIICVWVVEVLIYYTLDKSVGEELTLYSLIQLLGFVIIAGGSVWYSRSREVMVDADGNVIEGSDVWASSKKSSSDEADVATYTTLTEPVTMSA